MDDNLSPVSALFIQQSLQQIVTLGEGVRSRLTDAATAQDVDQIDADVDAICRRYRLPQPVIPRTEPRER